MPEYYIIISCNKSFITHYTEKTEGIFHMEERNTLLIVDDFEFNRLMLSDTFSDRQVIEAENGKRAIEEFERNQGKLCAVLLDIMMPVMDGFGVLEYLVENKYIDDIPVFIISADTSDKSLSSTTTSVSSALANLYALIAQPEIPLRKSWLAT